ncbi:MAG TPA: NADH:ubiquinone reductase (Na(+)-transporting) subunit F, partial [Afifellaceae bacterium]|nr:NADH:ubiquinone reductase (Na(+)-transporting) subunit F [Afifellaceae bacterium]
MTEILLGTAVFTVIVMLLALSVMAARAVLLPSTAVTITVNEVRRLPARTGPKLLGALLDGGISVPAACGGTGTCGLCRVTVTAGGGEALPTETARFTHREISEGIRLACQVTIRGDIAVREPDDLFEVTTWSCTVRSARTLAPLIKEIVLDLPAGAKLTFRAGAFVQVTAPPYQLSFADFDIAKQHEVAWQRFDLRKIRAASHEPVSRAYSIANRPSEAGCIILLVRLALPPPSESTLPPGIVSSYLFGVKADDRLSVSGPYGEFGARQSEREMVFIGGGVGMAPLRAIIFDQLERLGSQRKMSFWYGARSRADLFYVDEFDRLQAEHKNFHWTVALSDPAPDDDWDGATGFIHDVVFERHMKDHPAPEACEYYLCGPPLMIKAV